MTVSYFYVHDIESGRKAPIGAWIVDQDNAFHYVFHPDYYFSDELTASHVIDRMIEENQDTVAEGFLEYWQQNVGYYRSATEIHTETVDDLQLFLDRMQKAVN